jgi:LPXTG-motif cell wall-anchored protein
MDRDELLRQIVEASSPEEISTAESNSRAWLRDHPRDHQVALSLIELLQSEPNIVLLEAEPRKGVQMTKAAAGAISTVVMWTMLAGTAVAQYTNPPSPTANVQGAGGQPGAAAGDAAFTGGDIGTAVLVALALVGAGLVALFIARRRSNHLA